MAHSAACVCGSANELAQLRRQVEDLREQVRIYKATVAPAVLLPREWGLRKAEHVTLIYLYSAKDGFRTKEQLHTVICGPESIRGLANVRARMCQLRKKVAPHGIDIETVWLEGYRLSDKGRKVIAAILNGGKPTGEISLHLVRRTIREARSALRAADVRLQQLDKP